MTKYHVVIVGGGPAGSTCAYTLAKQGVSVLVVDFKRAIGLPVQCAEFVPVQLYSQFKEFFTDGSIAQRVENMLHFTPWGEEVSMWSEGFVLNREVFDLNIAKLAQAKGAEYMLRTRFLGFEDEKVWLENIEDRRKFCVEADMLVGADGPRSKVAKLTGKATEYFLTTAQVTMPLRKGLSDLLIYFRDYIPGGYGWVFPKGGVANVGIGVDPILGMNPMESLRRFIDEVCAEGMVEGRIIKRTGGWIPADGLLPLVRGKVALIGDAGGFCHPITGGGIANAVLSGSMLARAIVLSSLEEFEEEAWDTFGESLSRAANKRKKYMRSWNNLREIIPKTWIAFEEYWRII
ncbi:MAG: NAD(P)/FAD-dependent oxidoreductase [Acidobacteria bacterium]|jgi:geranylgeranyl reductase family protein|nr:MAG: NAD(P)/FAD-dependent oxidoreductase [Acidobacteriota bacterium]